MPPFMKDGLCKGFVNLQDYQECVDQYLDKGAERIGLFISVSPVTEFLIGASPYERFTVNYQVKDGFSQDVSGFFEIEAWVANLSTAQGPDWAGNLDGGQYSMNPGTYGVKIFSLAGPHYVWAKWLTNSTGRMDQTHYEPAAYNEDVFPHAVLVGRVYKPRGFLSFSSQG